MADVFGVGYVLKKVHADSSLKVLGIGLGWAFVDSVALLPYIWIKTRALEFDLQWVMVALEANVRAVLAVAFTAMVVIKQRKDGKAGKTMVDSLLAGLLAVPMLANIAKSWLPITAVLPFEAAAAAALALTVKAIF